MTPDRQTHPVQPSLAEEPLPRPCYIALVTYMATAFPAALVLAYSGLSFFQDQFTDHRKLRVAQTIASLPLVLLGGFVLVKFWLRTP